MPFMNGRRDVSLVAAAKGVSWLGDEAALVALTLHTQSSGGGAAGVAALLIANTLPIVLLSGPVGRLVDRHDNRLLLALSSIVQLVACAVLAFVPSHPVILALLAVLGAGQAVNSATWSALVPAMVAPDDLPRALGLTQTATTFAGIVAPALGGLLYASFGTRVPLLVDAVSFGAVLVAALAVHTRRAVSTTKHAHGGAAIVARDPLLRALFGLLALFVLLGCMVNVVDVFLIRETLGASPTWYGITGACYSVGALAGAVLSGRLLRGTTTLARALVGSCVVLAAGLAAMGGVPSVAWLLPLGLITGCANGALNVAQGSLIMGRTAPGERGRVAALLSGVASGTQLVAYGAGGALTSVLEPRTVFALAGGLGLLAPVLLGRTVLRAARITDTADLAVMETVS